jgi:hypothetical protein
MKISEQFPFFEFFPFFHVIPTEKPEVPYGIKVTDKDGRSVKLQWNAPYDGNSPLTRYSIEYKTQKSTLLPSFLLALTLAYVILWKKN